MEGQIASDSTSIPGDTKIKFIKDEATKGKRGHKMEQITNQSMGCHKRKIVVQTQ